MQLEPMVGTTTQVIIGLLGRTAKLQHGTGRDLANGLVQVGKPKAIVTRRGTHDMPRRKHRIQNLKG